MVNENLIINENLINEIFIVNEMNFVATGVPPSVRLRGHTHRLAAA
jgi:hypothetical protein